MSPPADRRFEPKQDRSRRSPGSSRFGSARSRWGREEGADRSDSRDRPERPRRVDRGDRPERSERRPFSPRRPFRDRPIPAAERSGGEGEGRPRASGRFREAPDRFREAPTRFREAPARFRDSPARFSPSRPSSPAAGKRRFEASGRPSERSEEPRGEAASHAADSPSDLVWGRHAVLAILESGRPVHRIWCTTEMRFSPRFMPLLREAKASGVLLEEVTWARLGQISAGGVHQGIVLQPAAAESLDLPTLIDGCRDIGEAPLLVAVDGLTDPQNLGAIVRSAEALGAHGVVLPQRRNAGLTGSVAKVAAGALEHLPVARVVNLNRALDSLKQEGYRVVGLAAEGTVSLEEADLSGPLVLVTGSEADGLSMLTRRSCDQLVRIPLRGTTPSLNAAVATALLLYEVARRGWMRGLSGGAPPPRLVRPPLPAPPAPPPEPAPVPFALSDQDTLSPSASAKPDDHSEVAAEPPPEPSEPQATQDQVSPVEAPQNSVLQEAVTQEAVTREAIAQEPFAPQPAPHEAMPQESEAVALEPTPSFDADITL
jgi:23S rRNA (guanosine2251-2'-O)-methyltransferase